MPATRGRPKPGTARRKRWAPSPRSQSHCLHLWTPLYIQGFTNTLIAKCVGHGVCLYKLLIFNIHLSSEYLEASTFSSTLFFFSFVTLLHSLLGSFWAPPVRLRSPLCLLYPDSTSLLAFFLPFFGQKEKNNTLRTGGSVVEYSPTPEHHGIPSCLPHPVVLPLTTDFRCGLAPCRPWVTVLMLSWNIPLSVPFLFFSENHDWWVTLVPLIYYRKTLPP